MANEVFEVSEGKAQPTGTHLKNEAIAKLDKSHYVRWKESSEDLASIVHFMLAISLF